jgi:hypothetical protein
MMPLLFAAGDVGGARALLPIINLAEECGQRPLALRHGALTTEPNVRADWIDLGALSLADPAQRPQAYLFTGSVADPVPLRVARAAAAAGIPTIFVLDSWSSYTSRLTTDGFDQFKPDVYCVPDEKAKSDAQRAGVTSPIEVTGQPAFAGVLSEAQTPAARATSRTKILFVSEPVEADHGRRRGYTEAEAMAAIARGLQPLSTHVEVDVLPHPRDDVTRVSALWTDARGTLTGEVLRQNTLRSVVDYDGVAGIASVLLYRAWLLGRPAISCQPGLVLSSLRQFGERDGIVLIDEADGAPRRIQAWGEGLTPGRAPLLRPEAMQHAAAAETILQIAIKSGMEAPDVQ